MKKLEFFVLSLLAMALPAHSQLLLQQGQPWTYEFSNLPQIGFVSVFQATPNGSLSFNVRSSSWDAGDQLYYEMFENSTSDAPLLQGTMASAPPYTTTAEAQGAWQDKQGVIRLSMLQGSVILDEVTVQAIVAGPSLSSYDVCATTVPEPGTWSLMALAAGGFLCFRARAHKKVSLPRP